MKKVIYDGPEQNPLYGKLIELGAEDVYDCGVDWAGILHFRGTTLLEQKYENNRIEITLFGNEKDIGEVEKLVLPILKK